MAVARAGEDAVPALAAPVALRPFLQFAKLPPPALVAARRVLEADGAFRERVVEEVSEDDVGRAGWLFLTRPDGWRDDLEAMVARAQDARAVAADRRAEGDARRRLAAAEQAARRAEEAAETARAEAARAGEALTTERRARRDADRRAAELGARVEGLVAERDQAVGALAAARAAGEAAEAERRRARQLRAEPDADPSGDQVPSLPVPAPEPASAAPAGPALLTAAGAARHLADALEVAADAVADPTRAVWAPAPSDPGPVSPPPRSGPAGPRLPSSRPGPAGVATVAPDPPPAAPGLPVRERRREPARLPPGVLDDSVEAAEHLTRLRGAVLLVDGYNVSHAAWPGTPIAEQRRRLVDALAEVSARTGVDARVVFDGAESVGPSSVGTTSRAVRVTFSPADVEADDVIVAEVSEIPPGRPVLVASSDRRVRDQSARRGANVLHSSQLLALLRR